MKTAKQLERVTRRMRDAKHLFTDWARHRIVVSRRARGIARKTSVRFEGVAAGKSYKAALARAQRMAKALHECSPDKLPDFKFL